MTIDVEQQPQQQTYQPYVPAYSPPQPELYSNQYVNQGEQPTTYQTTIVRTKQAGGTGLFTIGILLCGFSFFFYYDEGLFWTLMAISIALCCVGSVIAYSGKRQYRTYVIHVSNI